MTIYIHELKDWPNFIWDAEKISLRLIHIHERQGRLLGMMTTLGFPLQEEASLLTLTQNIVKSSAIEGDILNLDEVRSSIARRIGIESAALIPSSRYIEAIVEMMLDATQNFERPLTQERLCNWQAALFPTGRSGLQQITVGNFRGPSADPMEVVSGPMGREKIHFEAPKGSRVPKEMQQFLTWINKDSPELDLFVKAAIAHLWFVTIHPFEDGNGRIARAIADLFLARADQTPQRFYSLSAQIEAERKQYYAALETQQKGNLNITSWLEWFLDCLNRSFSKAESTLGEVLLKARVWSWIHHHGKFKPNSRQTEVINRLLENFEGHLNTSKYAKLAKCSSDSALRDIQEMVEIGLLLPNLKGGRSTSYQLNRLLPS
jgi:Fic family protein